jgi:protein-arginine kinase activator protein McsA
MTISCDTCSKPATCKISWPLSKGYTQSNVCNACGQSIWKKLNKDFSGTEAVNSFTIEPLPVEETLT